MSARTTYVVRPHVNIPTPATMSCTCVHSNAFASNAHPIPCPFPTHVPSLSPPLTKRENALRPWCTYLLGTSKHLSACPCLRPTTMRMPCRFLQLPKTSQKNMRIPTPMPTITACKAMMCMLIRFLALGQECAVLKGCVNEGVGTGRAPSMPLGAWATVCSVERVCE